MRDLWCDSQKPINFWLDLDQTQAIALYPITLVDLSVSVPDTLFVSQARPLGLRPKTSLLEYPCPTHSITPSLPC